MRRQWSGRGVGPGVGCLAVVHEAILDRGRTGGVRRRLTVAEVGEDSGISTWRARQGVARDSMDSSCTRVLTDKTLTINAEMDSGRWCIA
jgi:hypothetical protein